MSWLKVAAMVGKVLNWLRRPTVGIFSGFLIALVAMNTTGWAAEIKLISLRFSFERPVPHIHVEGPLEKGDGKRLEDALRSYTRCAGNCRPGFSGGPKAVVSFSSSEGSLSDGINIAKTLEEFAAASYVQTGDACLSGCAVAFLGGTGFWPTGGVGAYSDRLIEPGALLGFSLKYTTGAPSDERAPLDQRKEESDIVAHFLRAMNNFDVESGVYEGMVSATPDKPWLVDTPSKLYAIRALLPAFDATLLGTGFETQLRNACAVLLARHYGTSIDWQNKLLATKGLRSSTDILNRSIKTFGVDDVAYSVTGCGTNETYERLPLEEVHVYKMADAANGLEAPVLSMFNPVDNGWAQIHYPGGSGGNTHKILALREGREKRSVLNHLLMSPDQKLAGVPQEVKVDIRESRYIDERAKFPIHSKIWPLRLHSRSVYSKVYDGEGLVVVERIGSVELFDALIEDSDRTDVTYSFDRENVAVRSGIDGSTDTSYYWLALRDDEQAAIIRIEAMGQPSGFSRKQRELSSFIACSAALGKSRLKCFK